MHSGLLQPRKTTKEKWQCIQSRRSNREYQNDRTRTETENEIVFHRAKAMSILHGGIGRLHARIVEVSGRPGVDFTCEPAYTCREIPEEIAEYNQAIEEMCRETVVKFPDPESGTILPGGEKGRLTEPLSGTASPLQLASAPMGRSKGMSLMLSTRLSYGLIPT